MRGCPSPDSGFTHPLIAPPGLRVRGGADAISMVRIGQIRPDHPRRARPVRAGGAAISSCQAMMSPWRAPPPVPDRWAGPHSPVAVVGGRLQSSVSCPKAGASQLRTQARACTACSRDMLPVWAARSLSTVLEAAARCALLLGTTLGLVSSSHEPATRRPAIRDAARV